MVTGYEAGFYRDIDKIAKTLDRIAKVLESKVEPTTERVGAETSPPWEHLIRDEPFAGKRLQAQRDELLAAVGLLVEALALSPIPNNPLMKDVVETMGNRYGPWSR